MPDQPPLSPGRVTRKRSDSPGPDDWTASQLAIITAPVESRLIVEAVPGAGKTAVACARVAKLVQNEIPATGIWLISFTRTAVQEIRNRIARLCVDDEAAYGVRIATVDSNAWQLVQGFGTAKSSVFSTYEQNITDVNTLLADPSDDLRAELESINHLIIDEVQDVVGTRRDFIRRLIQLLPAETGVTLLCDPAQAIFGFIEDDDVPVTDTSLAEVLKADPGLQFEVSELTDVIRTVDPGLRHIFVNTRQLVLNEKASLRTVYSDLLGHAIGTGGSANGKGCEEETDGCLILYRRRVEVLKAGSWRAGKGKPFRLRMSGHPFRVAPWLGRVFWDWTSPRVTETEFLDRYWERIKPHDASPSPSAADAWSALVRCCGITHTVVDTVRLRGQIAQRQPPHDFVINEIGDSGPILGTIHGSKGRESEEVHLMYGEPPSAHPVSDEEKRVLFVGATRARQTLKIGFSDWVNFSKLVSGRCYSATKSGVQVEIGRNSDIDEIAQVSRSLYPKAESVEAVQGFLYLTGKKPFRVGVRRVSSGSSSAWQLHYDDYPLPVGRLDDTFQYDLAGIASEVWSKRNLRLHLNPRINNVFIMCSRTIALPHGDPRLSLLHEPWASSGFWLVPVIFGYPMGY